MVEKTEAKNEFEREYVIPLRRNWNKVPRYKRANKAIRTIKEFLVRHMKIRDGDLNKVKIDRYLNEFVWFRGIRKPPAKIKVKAVKEGEIVKAELSELPKELAFKKAKLEKREEKGAEAKGKKKPEEKPEKVEETAEEKEEEKKKTEEKKASVVEAGKEMEKAAAKTMKHQTKMSKQPKRQRRMALQK